MAVPVRCIKWCLNELHEENTKWWTFILIGLFLFTSDAAARAEDSRTTHDTYTAIVNITYKDPVSGQVKTEKDDIGLYGQNSRIEKEWGWVVHVRTNDNHTHGCTPPVNVPPKERWIALISRGSCKFTKKILNAAVMRNASAVVIYNHEDEDKLLTMDHKGENNGEQSECCGGALFFPIMPLAKHFDGVYYEP